MRPLAADELLDLDAYEEARAAYRDAVIELKARRRLAVGDRVSLVFENRETLRFQVQEMLRIERIYEDEGIRDELEAYNPLVPDGSNLKATMMIEYPDVEERKRALSRLKGVEDRVWVQAGEGARSYAIADEDLERENEQKTSAVHFLRFEFDLPARQALAAGAGLTIGVDHPQYQARVTVAPEVRAALAADLS